MDCKSILERSKELPFHSCSFFTIASMFKSNKDKMLEKLENNNFTKNMLDHVNGLSKNNYTCGYFDEMGIHNLTKQHIPNGLKIFHANIESLKSNGTNLSFYLSCLNFKFDIICLTETRTTSIGILDKHFPDYNIFLDNPKSVKGAKGGVAILLSKNKFEDILEITEISTNVIPNLNLKNNCRCKKMYHRKYMAQL